MCTKSESELWLRDFCATHDCPDYDTVMKAIEKDQPPYSPGEIEGTTCLDSEYLHFNGWDAHSKIPAEFWDHVKNVIGEEPRARAEYFSCSC